MVKISVVIPTYNRPERLQVCLQSLTRQTLPSEYFEVIVVDDGSSADISHITTPFQEPLSLKLIEQANKGPAAARNAGADEAQGTFLAFTDDDCSPHESWLERLLAVLQGTPAVMVGGHTINQLTDNVYAQANQNLIDYIYEYYAEETPELQFFASNNLALSLEGFRLQGGFEREFPSAGGEDREFCDRWIHRGNSLRYLPDAMIYHSHEMTLKKFCELHYRYGTGARRFWSHRTARGQKPRELAKPGFYIGLLQSPWRRPLPKPLYSSFLLALSQLANGIGYFSARR